MPILRALSATMILTAALLLAACGALPAPALTPPEEARLASLLPADALLIGEQHDAPEHHLLERQVVAWLAARGQLAALALEMAEQGHGTAGLPPDASQAQVRAALAWNDDAWPWRDYGPAIMAAVRAGVPVLGANLPAARLREAMRDTALDTGLPPPAMAVQQQRIREGHCELLPERQIQPMTRVQIARDMAMARTLEQAHQRGRTVLLITGNGHVHRSLGVPRYLPPDWKTKVLSAQAQRAQVATENEADEAAAGPALHAGDLAWPTPPVPPRDHCAELREQMKTPRRP